VKVNWAQYINHLIVPSPFYSELAGAARRTTEQAAPAEAGSEWLTRLKDAIPGKRHHVMVDFIRLQATKALGLEANFPIDPRQPLQGLGLDSLMAVELRNLLGAGLKTKLPTTLVFDHPTIDALASYVEKDVFKSEAPVVEVEDNSVQQQAVLSELEQISDDEAEALLMEELRAIQKKR
jgi:myxalamid-type polyketide synthase MxaC